MNEHNERQSGEHPQDLSRNFKDQPLSDADWNDKEEYAAEFAPIQAPVEVRRPVQLRDDQENGTYAQSKWLGYTALFLGIFSMFIFPRLFGSLAMLLGVISYFQGNRALGVWSVILGLISLAGYFLLVPLIA